MFGFYEYRISSYTVFFAVCGNLELEKTANLLQKQAASCKLSAPAAQAASLGQAANQTSKQAHHTTPGTHHQKTTTADLKQQTNKKKPKKEGGEKKKKKKGWKM